MWICKQCQRENEDGAAFCPQCGGPRAAGRFDAPSGKREKVFRTAKNAYRVPDTGVTERRPRRGFLEMLARIAGTLLAAALPALTVALAILRRSDLAGALLPLFFADGEPGFWGDALYALLTAAAALLALLPGLWTLLLCREKR